MVEKNRRKWLRQREAIPRSFPTMCMRVQHSQAPGIGTRCAAAGVPPHQQVGRAGTL